MFVYVPNAMNSKVHIEKLVEKKKKKKNMLRLICDTFTTQKKHIQFSKNERRTVYMYIVALLNTLS